jgi:Flp pilus assembly protein TadG
MIMKIRERFVTKRSHNDKERGSDLVVTLFMLPFFIALLFAIVDVSSYFQTKTQVQNITRDGARLVALMGGSSDTIPLNREKFGGNGVSVTKYVSSRLVDSSGQCRISGCNSAPTVTCGPTKATNLTQDAYCRVTYNYRGVGGGIVAWLGFDNVTNNQIRTEEIFKVETSW